MSYDNDNARYGRLQDCVFKELYYYVAVRGNNYFCLMMLAMARLD